MKRRLSDTRDSGEELRHRAKKELDKLPGLKAILAKEGLIEKYDPSRKNFVVNRNPTEGKLVSAISPPKRNRKPLGTAQSTENSEDIIPLTKFKESFYLKLKTVFRACRKMGYSPFIALSREQRKIALLILRRGENFKWIQTAKSCGLTPKEFRVQISKIQAFLDRFIKNDVGTRRQIDNDLLVKRAEQAQKNDKWKYCQAEFSLPSIMKSNWSLNSRILDFLGLPDGLLEKVPPVDMLLFQQGKVLVRKDRVRKAQLNRIRPLLRRHGVKVETSPYELPYDKALIRASL